MAFDVRDDIKKSCPFQDALDLKYFDKQLKNFVKSIDSVFDSGLSRVSLWEAALFPVCSSAEESLNRTLGMVLCVDECVPCHSKFTLDRSRGQWLSMADVLLLKDTDGMVNYQKKLFDKIIKRKKS